MDGKYHILISDDDPVVHEALGIYLEAEGFMFTSARDGEEAIIKFFEVKPDLLVLDLMMPKKTGIDVCREIRKTSSIPVIMLTAKGEEVDRILGLELGADDYIVKPFSPREVIARIKAVLRRISDRGADVDDITNLGLDVSLEKYKISYDRKTIQATPKEVELLHTLVSHPGQVFTREQLLSKVWGYDYFGDTRTVDTHIKRIRAKLPDHIAECLKTIYGVGYKFEVN